MNRVSESVSVSLQRVLRMQVFLNCGCVTHHVYCILSCVIWLISTEYLGYIECMKKLLHLLFKRLAEGVIDKWVVHSGTLGKEAGQHTDMGSNSGS